MLLRNVTGGYIAVSQPAHALLSGKLAGAWGNSQFAKPTSTEAFAAAIHDIGWLDWETRPAFDAQKGLPQVFSDVPVSVHTPLWARGVRHAATISPLVGVLISLHAETIYEKTFDFAKAAPDNAETVRTFLAEQRSERDRILQGLRGPEHDPPSIFKRLAYAKKLIAAVDLMSLLVCWSIAEEQEIEAPTSLESATTLLLKPLNSSELTLDPWPFEEDQIRLTFDGRRIPSKFLDEAEMTRGLADAQNVRIDCTLAKARRSGR